MSSDLSSVRQRMAQLARDYQRIVQKAQTAEQRQVEDYRARLAVLVERYAQAKPAPPKPLTIPVIFGRSYDENFISDYLAYVLDPTKNGIGEAPLAQLLRLCDIEPVDLPLTEVTIHREYALENGRIDLLLEWEDLFVLGIENKILSSEGKEQTARYAQAIRRKCGEMPYHLIYLTRGGQRARSKKFQPLSFYQLVNALREIQVAEDVTPRQRVLWEDFLEHLEVYIIMADPEHFEFSEKAQLYLDHLDMLLDLESTAREEWDEFVSHISYQVAAHLDGESWTTSFNGRRIYHQVQKATWQSSGVRIHYEYVFSLEKLRQQDFLFVVDVEGPKREQVLALFDKRHGHLEATYRERGISYRPQNRRHAIAWKTYPISRYVDQIAQAFIDALDEFEFLEGEIDDAVAEWKRNSEVVA